MDEIKIYLNTIFENNILKLVFSNSINTDKYKKIVLEKKDNYYQIEKYTDKQVFHERLDELQLFERTYQLLITHFKQLNAWDEKNEYSIKISKKGKVLYSKKVSKNRLDISDSHNKKKEYLIEEGTIVGPLTDLGIFTKDGRVISSMYDKFKQINKFLEIIDDAIKKLNLSKINIIDFGCGKAYLTFSLYYYLKFIKKIEVNIIGLDLKSEVIDKCDKIARKYNYDNLQFELGDINGYKTDKEIDMVISLHACDTATDYALYNSINWGAKIIISVPCCQHELNSQMNNINILQRYGIIKERFASLMTDSIRTNLLGYCGYKSQLLEFVDAGNTPKNLLIRAVKTNIKKEHKEKLYSEVEEIMKEFNVSPTLFNLLKKPLN